MTVILPNPYYAPDEAALAEVLADAGATLALAGHDVEAACSARAYADPLRRSDRVVALGECMGEHLRRQGAGDVVVIHNWADEDVIRPRAVADHPLRTEWGWRGRFVVAYSGNLGLAHEFETVLAAAERLRDHPSVLFTFIGGGPRRPEVETAAEERGLPNVEFRPHMERGCLGESLTAPDVHLVSLRDSVPGLLVPSKIYGILAAGRPTLYVVTRARGAGAFVRLIEGLVAGEA